MREGWKEGGIEGGRKGGREKEKTWVNIILFQCGLHRFIHLAIWVSPRNANVVEYKI